MSMNSVDVLKALDDIKNTSARNEKEQKLAAAVADPMMVDVLKLAYDPFITFGLKPPKVETKGRLSFDGESPIWALFYSLQTRRVSGNEAKQLVLEWMQRLNQPSADLMWRILSKDLRCGITEKTVNKVLPGTIPVFDVMLAHPFEAKRIKVWPVAVEPKLDGVRVAGLVKDGAAGFFSRTGKPFPAVQHLSDELARLVADATIGLGQISNERHRQAFSAYLGSGTHRLALDGEIVSGTFNKTVGDVRRKSVAAEDAEYHVFDALPFARFTGDERVIPVSYKSRRLFVSWLLGFAKPGSKLRLVPRYFANSPEEIQDWYRKFRDRKLEGAIVKPFEAPYEKRRSHGWMKIKAEETGEFRVIGAYEGEGKYAGMLGGLDVSGEVGGRPITAKVGGGFSDRQREEFWRVYLQDKANGHAAAGPFELIGRLIEVEYHEVTPDGSLRHPRFIRFRDDKDTMEEAA